MPAAPAPGAPLPWIGHRRRSAIRDAATPLLVAALRRLWAIPMTAGCFQADVERLDRGRPTRARLAHVAAWHRGYPDRSRPFLHDLRHTGWVLRACGLTPSRVHQVRGVLGLDDAAAPDAVLLAVAHLSAVSCFGLDDLALLHHRHGWAVADLIAWSQRWDYGHFAAAVAAGWGREELGALLRTNEVPDRGQVGLLAALQAPPPPAG